MHVQNGKYSTKFFCIYNKSLRLVWQFLRKSYSTNKSRRDCLH